jgi:hypothetical protein
MLQSDPKALDNATMSEAEKHSSLVATIVGYTQIFNNILLIF